MCSASEVFQKQMSEMFEDIHVDGVECVVDDVLVWGNNQAEHNMRLKQVLERANARGLRLNKSKAQNTLRPRDRLLHHFLTDVIY